MPHPFKKVLNQTALLWTETGVDERGNPVLDSYIEISVRWDLSHVEVLGPNQQIQRYDASALVDRKIEEGSIMFLGDESEWLGTGSGNEDQMLHQVTDYSESKDIKGRNTLRTVKLIQYGSEGV